MKTFGRGATEAGSRCSARDFGSDRMLWELRPPCPHPIGYDHATRWVKNSQGGTRSRTRPRPACRGDRAGCGCAVDPIDENARAFYDKFSFKQIRGDAGGRMYLRIDDALAALEDPD